MPLHNRGTITIIGLYNWDDKIFDDLVLPTGIDKDEIVEDILFTCADLEIMYPDWNVMKKAIKTWSEEEIFKWNRIDKLAKLEYNPIENYDRIESETISDSRQKKGNDIGTTEITNNNVVNNGSADSNTRTHAVTGYNTTTPVTDTQDTTTASNTNSGASTGKAKSADARNTFETETGDKIRNNRTHGNIGVTAPYQMILGDLSVYDSINLYKIIPEEFKMRFCLMVY